jgi:hypothetical protein
MRQCYVVVVSGEGSPKCYWLGGPSRFVTDRRRAAQFTSEASAQQVARRLKAELKTSVEVIPVPRER